MKSARSSSESLNYAIGSRRGSERGESAADSRHPEVPSRTSPNRNITTSGNRQKQDDNLENERFERGSVVKSTLLFHLNPF